MIDVAFAGQVRPIVVRLDCDRASGALADDIRLIAPGWPAVDVAGPPDIVVTPAAEGFAIAIGAYETPEYRFATRLAAAHGVVGALIGSYVVQDATALALHAASVLTRDGFLVLLGDHGAGKSTLAVALAAAGMPLGGDDRIVLRHGAAGWQGRSLGLVPKLRLPLPAEAPAAFLHFVDTHHAGADGDMNFVTVPTLLAFGTTAPVVGIALLRRAGGAAALVPLERAALTRELVTTAFAPHLGAAARLAQLAALSSLPAFRLDYGSSFEAADFLARRFP